MIKEKIPSIQLLTPNGSPKGIIESEHNSKWTEIRSRNIDSLLTSNQLTTLNKLVRENQCIIEETNNLIEMIRETD